MALHARSGTAFDRDYDLFSTAFKGHAVNPVHGDQNLHALPEGVRLSKCRVGVVGPLGAFAQCLSPRLAPLLHPRDELEGLTTIGGGRGGTPLPLDPDFISEKKLGLQKETLMWAIFGSQIFGFQETPPPPSLLIHPCGGPVDPGWIRLTTCCLVR